MRSGASGIERTALETDTNRQHMPAPCNAFSFVHAVLGVILLLLAAVVGFSSAACNTDISCGWAAAGQPLASDRGRTSHQLSDATEQGWLILPRENASARKPGRPLDPHTAPAFRTVPATAGAREAGFALHHAPPAASGVVTLTLWSPQHYSRPPPRRLAG